LRSFARKSQAIHHGAEREDHVAGEAHPLPEARQIQLADPLIVAHAAQALQVIDGGSDHAWNGRDRLEHDRSMAVPLGEERVRTEAQRLGEALGDAVGQARRRLMNIQVNHWSSHFYLLEERASARMNG
jgi:hypothetical protein